ncbi:helix-turn-helix transcriptional regulator [Streptomyces sp. NPDC097619]|uniref:helix-turn-helix transcriptional regulator n=1 Tax=Streptomyces sp. NPDC097619 TaxID=3157228 RepID=UPI0033295577
MPDDLVSPAARRLYAFAADRYAFTAAEAVTALGPAADPGADACAGAGTDTSPGEGGGEGTAVDSGGVGVVEIGEALAELVGAGLLRRVPDGADGAGARTGGVGADGGGGGDAAVARWAAVEPRAAAAGALAPLAERVRRAQEEMDRTRLLLESFAPAYEAGAAQRARDRSADLELITDLGAVRALIAELSASCQEELLTSQPGGGRAVETLEEAIGRDECMLARGVRMRTVYQHTARYNRPTAAYVERVTALGAQVRTLGDGLMRMLVFDRRTGLIAARGPDGAPLSGAALVVREPSVVEFMTAAFERSWAGAEPFPVTVGPDLARTISDELRQTIVRLLADGVEDKVIARRLGMSERTCQRHIAEIMRAVGARSRFQAGWLAGAASGGVTTDSAPAADSAPAPAPAAAERAGAGRGKGGKVAGGRPEGGRPPGRRGSG